MNDSSPNHHPDWDINKGDYKPDPHSTNRYIKKVKRNYYLKRIIGIIIYGIILGIIVYWILS